MKTILVFIIIFSVVVVIHEFGHYFFAKRAGILVREFAIGMGPKLFAHQGKDGTTYTIRMLPLGGYVQMAGWGEDETELTPGMPISLVQDKDGKVIKINTSKKVQLPHAIPMEVVDFDLEEKLTIAGYINGNEQEKVAYAVDHDATVIHEDGVEVRIAPKDVQFQSAKLWQRMLTNFAGPMNNFILAFVLFTGLVFAQGGVQDVNTTSISGIQNGSPAAEAGLKDGDEILAVNGKTVSNWQELSSEIQNYPDTKIPLEVKRGSDTLTIEATPEGKYAEGEKVGFMGISPGLKTSLGDKLLGGLKLTFNNALLIFRAVGNLIVQPDLDKLGGPVAIFQLSSQAASQGVASVVMMMAAISINLGIFNLLPIPGLDGGKLVLNILEGVRGKPISQEKEGIITLIGFGFLMLLMVLVTWNDIQRFFF
ncbi:RIP metalloprotease RseP [Enterococcus gallinarum]|uniref:RIP metalloprotease RseP n=1 Tax=Enterococcus gallinarum TaxID=1353 RepID=UPI0012AB39FB|nr:RIP metalloprotease RseP [Enterococcus gallinarum]MBS7179135.1 RIP metalloprotease RseP [Enterococcus gallinarum]MBU5358208.1 RIP metalloprotease RseP [Enterococcus gallinarum]